MLLAQMHGALDYLRQVSWLMGLRPYRTFPKVIFQWLLRRARHLQLRVQPKILTWFPFKVLITALTLRRANSASNLI